MNKERLNYKNVLVIIGAILAFSIGSGFSTGQELTQYIASYGYNGIFVGIIFFIIFTYSNYAFSNAGAKEKFEKGSDVFRYFCGDAIGTAFDYFSVFFCYLSFIVMISGFSTTLKEHYGAPIFVGAVILAALAAITVIFGLENMLNTIGFIGPVIIVIALFIGFTSFFQNLNHLNEGAELIATGDVKLLKASPNWFMAGCSYGGFVLLWFGSFMGKLGSTYKMKELKPAIIIASFLNSLAIIIVGLAQVASVREIVGAQIPNLVLASQIFPFFTSIFAIIILAAIFSTSVPLLWTACSRFAKEGTTQFRGITILLAVVALIITLMVPFNRLLNVVYVLNGYAGFILLLFMVVKDIKTRINSKHTIVHRNKTF